MSTSDLPKDPVTLIAEQLATISQRLDSFDQRFTIYDNSFVEINNKLVTISRSGPQQHFASGSRTAPRQGLDTTGTLQLRNNGRDPEGPSPFKLRLEQPQFNGEDPHTWVFKAEEYFDYYQVPADRRLRLASLMMTGDAASWYQYQKNNNLLHTWHHFVEEIKERFDSDYRKDFFGVLSKMCQTTTVADFRTNFERVLNRVTNATEEQLIAIWTAGLKPPLNRELELRKPLTLQQAFSLSQILETSMTDTFNAWQSSTRKPWQHPTRIPSQANNGTQPRYQPVQPSQPAKTTPPVRRLTMAQKQEYDEKGLCYKCDGKWHRGHRCENVLLMFLDDHDSDELLPPADDESTEEAAIVGADISFLNSMAGTSTPRSLRFRGTITRTPVLVLVDGGSSHNFIRPDVVEKLKIEVATVPVFRVYVGNGQSLPCSQLCRRIPLELQQHIFTVDLYVLPIHGPEVVLGIQWLSLLGQVTHDYAALTMDFSWEGRRIKLKGDHSACRTTTLNTLQGLSAKSQLEEAFELFFLEKQGDDVDPVAAPDALPQSVTQLLQQYASVFREPVGLPPRRFHDHRIFLNPGAKPVNVKPYRYPHLQKTQIEKMVREMMEQGIIRPSRSPFSSPVLLVKKKDGSFRFCVDYRALNAVTIPDHFPIPTADELFDELGSARVFTKLDLRAGYHQIRMHSSDIHKTAFRTHDGHFEFMVMPFGLTNAPSTFQACMNKLFQPYLRKFIIVFFDDILLYSATLEDHIRHLELALDLLMANRFFVKMSKCVFCTNSVEYLGHVVSDGCLKVDPEKVQAMISWPKPKTLKQLRGFLGLTGYYRRFVKHYAFIAAPLTNMLRTDGFKWSPESDVAFESLKTAMTTVPVLRLPNFSETFIIETDASNIGIGAVLMQSQHPIAYFSKKLGARKQAESAYHRELHALVEAVYRWRQYLIGREFVIRTDQKSLTEIFTQVIQTPTQQYYVRKLLGFRFRVEYKAGASNRVADALSRRDDESDVPQFLPILCQPPPLFLNELKEENRTLGDLIDMHKAVSEGKLAGPFSVHNGLLYYKHRLVLSDQSKLKESLLQECHSAPAAGHPGVERTFRRVVAAFYWPKMREDVRRYVAACTVCQMTKYSTQPPTGLLQPLPIPEMVWDQVTMDFIVGLPPSRGYTAIMVVVDRLTKYTHLGPLPTGFDAPRVATLFMEMVVKLHGFPSSIVSDRDTIFLSHLWTELMKHSGTTLKRSTAYHPQTDGQSEVMNRSVEQYLRAYTHARPNRWVIYLPWAEYALNTSYHSALNMSPFQALYGRPPPTILPYQPGSSKVAVVDSLLQDRDVLLRTLRDNLNRSQNRMRDVANRKRQDAEFKVGDKVLLKLQPYRQGSVKRPKSAKLAPRYYGPFVVLERIGEVAYRLELPPGAKIHNVFHISLLRRFVEGGGAFKPTEWPSEFVDHQPCVTPVAILNKRKILTNGVLEEEWLIEWSDSGSSSATWEPAAVIQEQFPGLRLADKSNHNGGVIDTGVVEAATDMVNGDMARVGGSGSLGKGKRKKRLSTKRG